LSPSKAPNLDSIIDELWPGIELEGKDGSGPRISNWGADKLMGTQVKYVCVYGYSTSVSYNRIMQITDPKVQG